MMEPMQPEAPEGQESPEGGGFQAEIEGALATINNLASMKGAPPEAQKAFAAAAQAMQQGLEIIMGGGGQPQQPAMNGSGKEQFVG